MAIRLDRFALVALGILLAMPVSAAELLMYRRAGCSWCAAWDRDIGPIYAKTDIGRQLPLRFVDLGRESRHGIALASPVRYTPTFVLVEGTKELGRIEGYPGEDFFWGYLERLIGRIPVRDEMGEKTRAQTKPGEMPEQIR